MTSIRNSHTHFPIPFIFLKWDKDENYFEHRKQG